MKTFIRPAVFLAAVLAITTTTAVAQSREDMWTALAKNTGAYDPHPNFCTSSEAFISIGGGDLGYCIEEDERTAATWATAKQECAADGKRLPEPAEFQYACVNGVGLNNMTDDWEYASNTPFNESHDSAGIIDLQVIMMGNGSCTYANNHVVARNNGSSDSDRVYRCVR